MKTSIVEIFVERITNGKSKLPDRFYEIFSARGFLLEIDSSSGKVCLSNESHMDDCEFLEILQNINYKIFIVNLIRILQMRRTKKMLPGTVMHTLMI